MKYAKCRFCGVLFDANDCDESSRIVGPGYETLCLECAESFRAENDAEMNAKLVMTHNGGYDSVLLLDGEMIVSSWQCDRRVIEDYLRDGGSPEDWDVQHPDGIEFDGVPATVADFGEACGENGTISDSRREFWIR